MRKLIVTSLALLFLSFSVFAQCEDKYSYGEPTSNIEVKKLCRKEYAVLYSNSCKIPLVVSEKLLGTEIGGTEQRSSSFKVDMEIEEQYRATLDDYAGRKKKKIDIGHMAPAGDFTQDSVAMAESFLLSNTVPQYERMNRGIWRQLEMRVRALAVKYGEVYVITGVLVDHEKTIGSGVCVPTHMYKIIVSTKLEQSVGYLIPNVNDLPKSRFKDYTMSVLEIEEKSGFNLLPLINSKIKSELGKDLNQ
jgi:endonuclease G